jgi:hypothetical protein
MATVRIWQMAMARGMEMYLGDSEAMSFPAGRTFSNAHEKRLE